MKPVDQTTFGFPDGNCLAACIASIIGADLAAVDSGLRALWADGDHWLDGVFVILGAHGFKGSHHGADDPPKWYAVAFGPAARGFSHAVVVCDGALVHDPHPSREGLLKVTGYIAVERDPLWVAP